MAKRRGRLARQAARPASQATSKPPPAPPAIAWAAPKYSRKSKRITREGTLTFASFGVRIGLTGSPAALEAIDRWQFESGQPLPDLTAGMLGAVRAAPRWRQRRLLASANWYLASAYWHLELQRQRRAARIPAVEVARAEVERRVTEWRGFKPREQSILLAAHLVHSSMPNEWKVLRLGDPVSKPHGAAIDSLYRHHILKALAEVKARPVLLFPR